MFCSANVRRAAPTRADSSLATGENQYVSAALVWRRALLCNTHSAATIKYALCHKLYSASEFLLFFSFSLYIDICQELEELDGE